MNIGCAYFGGIYRMQNVTGVSLHPIQVVSTSGNQRRMLSSDLSFGDCCGQ